MKNVGIVLIIFAGVAALALIGAIVWGILIMAGKASLSFFRVGKRFAKQLGEEIDTRFPKPPKIDFTCKGHDAFIEFARSGSWKDRIMVTVKLDADSPGVLKIHREGATATFQRILGKTDVKIGDDVIDECFAIRSNPESLAHDFFDPVRRKRLLELLLKVEPYSDFRFDLSRHQMVVSIDGYPRRLDALNELERIAAEFLELVKETAKGTVKSIWVLTVSTSGIGLCQVCGSEMTEMLVYCRRCATPHHEECWNYLEMCSTYGCREISALKEKPA